jgi:LCP family protein required for cell wall assembly
MQSRKHRVQTKKKRFYKKKGFWIAVLIPVLLVLTFIGYYWYRIHHFVASIQDPASEVNTTTEWTGDDRVNIMLFGVDNRNNDPHPRSDVNLLISIDPKTHTAQMFSILRDTLYKIPGYSWEKINAAYSLGGANLAVKTFSEFLQIPIHYYAVTDFQGFEKVVDAVGGIDLDVEKNMDYVDDGVYDIHLKKGYQHLDGKHALMYVRFRHDAMADFTRTERQRKFLKALADKMKSPVNLLKLPTILDSIQPYIKTNMTMDTMLKLGQLGKDIDWSNMQSQQLPDMKDLTTGSVGNLGDCIIPNVYNTRLLVHQMLGMNDTIEKDPSVEYNGNIIQSPKGDLPVVTPKQTTPPTNPFGSNKTENPPTGKNGKPTGETGTGGTGTGGSGTSGTGTGGTGTGGTGTGGSGTGGTGTGNTGTGGTGTGEPGKGGTGTGGTGTGGTGTGGTSKGGTGTGGSGTGGTGGSGTGGTGTGSTGSGGTGTGGNGGTGTGTGGSGTGSGGEIKP